MYDGLAPNRVAPAAHRAPGKAAASRLGQLCSGGPLPSIWPPSRPSARLIMRSTPLIVDLPHWARFDCIRFASIKFQQQQPSLVCSLLSPLSSFVFASSIQHRRPLPTSTTPIRRRFGSTRTFRVSEMRCLVHFFLKLSSSACLSKSTLTPASG